MFKALKILISYYLGLQNTCLFLLSRCQISGISQLPFILEFTLTEPFLNVYHPCNILPSKLIISTHINTLFPIFFGSDYPLGMGSSSHVSKNGGFIQCFFSNNMHLYSPASNIASSLLATYCYVNVIYCRT